MHMEPQKTTSCQTYDEKEEQNWRHHTFCFLNILKSYINLSFERKIHRSYSGLNARSASGRRIEKLGGEEGLSEENNKGNFQGSE